MAESTTMKALVFHGKCNVKLQDVPLPTLQTANDVILRIELSGLCGSDMHAYHCREVGIDEGTCIMGHEFVGTIIEIGSNVQNFKINDRVASPFTTCCASCFYCKKGLTARCNHNQLFGWVSNGHGLQGAQAQYIRVPMADSTLKAIPDDVSNEHALLLGDIFSTGYFAADNAGITSDAGPTTVAVVGCGPVGLMAVVGAKDLGGDSAVVYAIDTVKERLLQAEKFGAVPVDGGVVNAVEVIKAATEGRGVDKVLELVGSPSALDLAVELVRPGGTISSCGCHTETGLKVVKLYDKNLTLKSGRCPARHYMDRLLPLVRSNKYDLTAIITHRLPLCAESYDIFDKKRDGCIKVVMDPRK